MVTQWKFFFLIFPELTLVFTCVDPTINIGGVGTLVEQNGDNLNIYETKPKFVQDEVDVSITTF